jgi:hypothetical protein
VRRRHYRLRHWHCRLFALSLLCLSLGPCPQILITSTIDGVFDGLTRNLVDIARAELGLTPTLFGATSANP